MLKRMSLLVAVVALMWASAPSAQAALIVGDLSITGDLVPVNISNRHHDLNWNRNRSGLRYS